MALLQPQHRHPSIHIVKSNIVNPEIYKFTMSEIQISSTPISSKEKSDKKNPTGRERARLRPGRQVTPGRHVYL